MKNIIILISLLLLVIISRSDISYGAHLTDFTLAALFITGVYLRQGYMALIIILISILVDNYAIIYQGVSANCITPAYSLLIISYYLVFYFAKNINTLVIDRNILNNTSLTTIIITVQWLVATLSYYIFSGLSWNNFLPYLLKWSIEIISTLEQLLLISIIITIYHYLQLYYIRRV